MSVLGLLLAALVDIAIPVLLVVLLARGNFARRQTNRGEVAFWASMAAYLAFLAIWVVSAILDVPRHEGWSVVIAGMFSFPMSIVPSAFNSLTMAGLFTRGEWADFGYAIVLPVFLVGLLAWAALLPVAIRALAGIERRNRDPQWR